MALLSLITQNKPQRTGFKGKDSGNDIFLVDATVSDSYEITSEVTDSPVEDGIDISDHARLKPITYQIEGEISETPLNLSASLQGLTTTAGATVGRELGGFGQSAAGIAGGFFGASLFQESSNPAKVARDKLEELIQNKTIFTIITKNKKLDDMILTSIRFPRAQGDGRKLKFSATAKQIRIVKSQAVLIKKIAKSASGSAAAKQKLGNKPTTAVTEAVEKPSSVLFKALKFVGGA